MSLLTNTVLKENLNTVIEHIQRDIMLLEHYVLGA